MPSKRRRTQVVHTHAARQDGTQLEQSIIDAGLPANIAAALEEVLDHFGANTVTIEKIRVDALGTNANVALGWGNFDGFYKLSTGVVIWTSNGTPAVLMANGLSFAFTTELRWAPNADLPGSHSGNAMDVGIGRAGVGILKISGGDESDRAVIQIGQPGARPAAAVGLRGTIWIEEGAGGVADVVYVCMKDAADAYAWVRQDNLGPPADHGISDTTVHNGVGGAVENNLASFDANGLPKDSGVAAANVLVENGVSGSFTTVDGKTITVVDGQITAIV